MKKLLLLATALLALAPVHAQESTVPVTYKEGNVITDPAQLTSGTYFIKAHAFGSNGAVRREGFVYNHSHNARAAAVYEQFSFPEFSTDNTTIVWKLDVKTEDLPAGATGDCVFSIQAMSGNNYYWSIKGQGGDGKHNVQKTTNVTEAGLYQLVAMPESYPRENYYGVYKDNVRFHMQLTNAQGAYSAPQYPFIHTNSDEAGIHMGYWEGNNISGTPVQFEIVEAVPVHTVNITVKFPPVNGVEVPDQVIEAALGDTPNEAIDYALDNLGYGSFNITGVSSSNGSQTVTEEGQVFTVQGTWACQLIAGHVYRIRINPNADATGALRYMISTGAIETRREGKETINRLVPERLWYFTEKGEGANKTYTLHTLYDTTKAVHFTSTTNGATAELADEATEFEFTGRQLGNFVLKIAGTTNSMVNDFHEEGFMSIYETDDLDNNGNLARLYPITDDDFKAMALFSDEATIAAAKANPTFETIKPLVDAYNAHNLEAALKRVDYLLSGDATIGINPGQYSDPSGEFVAAVEHARELYAQGDQADEAEVMAAIEAIDINKLDIATFTRNEVEAGVFYRFKNKTSGNYISCLNGGEANLHPVMAMTADGTRSNTVFYLQVNNEATNEADKEFTIVSFEDGRVMPRFYNTQKENWRPVLADDELATNEAKFAYQNNGRYVIHISSQNGHRHLHGANASVNVSGNSTDNDHQWFIERVTELPVTMYNIVTNDETDSNDGWSSIYSPVALEVPTDRLLTAYTGQFDGTDYSKVTDINHVLATPIAPNADGKVIIPGGQTALLFFDGENNDFDINDDPNINESLMNDRKHITYVNLPIAYGGETVSEPVGNIAGHVLAHSAEEGKEYYTLHATHSNNFREYGEWLDSYTYVPGFKAHIENDPDGVDVYPIYLINPNTMVPQTGEEGLTVNTTSEEGVYDLVIVTPSEDYVVYYKHTAAPEPETPAEIRHRAADHTGYDMAEKQGNVHTITVAAGTVDYYAYDAKTDTKGAVRTAPVNKDEAVGINAISADKAAAVVYDLQGRRMAAPAKGINIVNNKKVLVK